MEASKSCLNNLIEDNMQACQYFLNNLIVTNLIEASKLCSNNLIDA